MFKTEFAKSTIICIFLVPGVLGIALMFKTEFAKSTIVCIFLVYKLFQESQE